MTAVVGGGAPTGSEEAQSFEYEGRLVENGLPVNGVVDLEFGVFDAGIGGAQVGPTLFAEEVLDQSACEGEASGFRVGCCIRGVDKPSVGRGAKHVDHLDPRKHA